MNAYNLMIERLSKGQAIVPRDFAGVGEELVPLANQWMLNGDECAVFQFPLDTGNALSQWYLRREARRIRAEWRIGALNDSSIVIVPTDGSTFGKIAELITDWYLSDDWDFVWRMSDTSEIGKDWIGFEVEDTPEGIALTRDVKAILDKDALVSLDGIAGEYRIHVRWMQDDKPTDASAQFVDIMDRFLIDGVHDHETLMGVQEEHQVEFEGTLAQSIVNACMYTEAELNRFCDQFFGKGAVEYLRQHKLNVELDWSRGRWNYVANGDMPDAEGVYVHGDDDPDVVKAWAAWLDELYEAHVNGDVVLAAAGQPRLLEA